jgi:hypothetical protein
MPFLIQALDTMNDYRTTGGDRFAVRVVSADGKVEGEAFIRDLNDGKYEVHYSVPLPGSYLVHVEHADLGGTDQIPVRGSPFKVTAIDPWNKHRMLGNIPAVAKVSSAKQPSGLPACRVYAKPNYLCWLSKVGRNISPLDEAVSRPLSLPSLQCCPNHEVRRG